jgi:branched-chain amino acid transport system permease protein
MTLHPWAPKKKVLIGTAVVFALAAALPLVHSDYYTHNLITLTFITIAAALSWNWLGGYLGQVSFGHSALFGMGGFVAAQAMMKAHLPLVVAWIVGGLIAGLYGLIWGHPTLRLRGPYFSIATIGIGEATRIVCTYWDWLTGGASGLSLPVAGELKFQLYWYALALVLVVLIVSYLLRHSSLGLALLAIKSDVDAAADVGISSTRMQDLVMFLSGLTMGVCGGLYASYFSFIEPGDLFGFQRSIGYVLCGVIGGIATVAGPAVGAIIFVILQQYLIASYPQLYLGIFGLLLILVILFEPLGLAGLYFRVFKKPHVEDV